MSCLRHRPKKDIFALIISGDKSTLTKIDKKKACTPTKELKLKYKIINPVLKVQI